MTVQFNPKTGARGIEWTDRTENAIGGCMHECQWEMPDGTKAICYAKELAENGVAKKAYPEGFEHHYWRPENLKALKAGKDPQLIFPDSMSDMFAHYVPAEQLLQVLASMKQAPHHSYQSLTKAPGQLSKWTKHMPPNLWVGVSSPPDWFLGKHLSHEAQKTMLRKSLDILRKLKEETGNLVWMSLEPVSWDIAEVLGYDHPLDWAVIGAASKGKAYFQPERIHIDRLLWRFDETKTPVFYKGNIRKTIESNAMLGRWREDFPATYRNGEIIPAVARRQEMCRKHGWTLATFSSAEAT